MPYLHVIYVIVMAENKVFSSRGPEIDCQLRCEVFLQRYWAVQIPVGEDFSGSVSDRCQTSFVRIFGILIVAIIPVEKASNVWRTGRADYITPKLAGSSFTSVRGQVEVRPGNTMQDLALSKVFCHRIIILMNKGGKLID